MAEDLRDPPKTVPHGTLNEGRQLLGAGVQAAGTFRREISESERRSLERQREAMRQRLSVRS